MSFSAIRNDDMNRDYNPKCLRELDRLCIYKCDNCGRIVFLGYDAKDSNTPIKCKACEHYIDPDKDIIGDSWYSEEYPSVSFTVDEDNINEKTRKQKLVAWFWMECCDCKRMNWIAWKRKWFDYSTCQCHQPVQEKVATPAAPILLEHPFEDITIEKLIIPGELVGQLRNYCFENDLTKKDVLIEALRQFFKKNYCVEFE
jgi:DNA-directed RNA polymerase subunit RPC12/RpoP